MNIVYALEWISRLQWEIANGGSGYKSEDFFSEEGVSGFLTTEESLGGFSLSLHCIVSQRKQLN